MAGTLIGLALALLQGWWLAWWLWPGRAKPVLVLAALSLPAGLAASSSALFLWLVVSGGRTAWFPPLEVGATSVLAWIVWRRARARPGRSVWPRVRRPALAWSAPLGLAAGTAIVLVVLFRVAAASPWGYWDAWAMINQKARFLCAGGADWRVVFEDSLVHHPDYPLLLSCSVARLWCWSSFLGRPGFTVLQPQVLSLVTWLGCLGAVVAVVGRLCSPWMASLAGLAFLGLGQDLLWGGLQYTDFAQAGLFVWSAGVLAIAARRGACAQRWWSLLGFLTAATAWCKNEGLAFAGLLVLALALTRAARSWSSWARLVAGGLLPGLALVVLKLGFAAESRVFAPRSRSVLADLTDPSRWSALADFVAEHVRASWNWPALLALAFAALLLPARRGARRIWQPLVLALALALVFTFVMITTREAYQWHVETAVDRLLIQLWPLTVLALGAALRPG